MNPQQKRSAAAVLRAMARASETPATRHALFSKAAKLDAAAMRDGVFGDGSETTEARDAREARGSTYSLPRWFVAARKACTCTRCGKKGARWYHIDARGRLARVRVLHLIRAGLARDAQALVNAPTTTKLCRACWQFVRGTPPMFTKKERFPQ